MSRLGHAPTSYDWNGKPLSCTIEMVSHCLVMRREQWAYDATWESTDVHWRCDGHWWAKQDTFLVKAKQTPEHRIEMTHDLLTTYFCSCALCSQFAMVVCYAANEFMGLGLEFAGYKWWKRYKESWKIECFKAHFGAHPMSCEQMWNSLQMMMNDNCRIDASANPKYLLLGLYFLWEYPTEKKFYPMFQLCKETVRNKCREWTKKIQVLPSSWHGKCMP